MRTEWTLIMMMLCGGLLLLSSCGGAASESDPAALDLAEALSADTVGYERADRPYAISFPDDHGPHPGFRTEWWYYTGNLEAADGRRFGYQFTIFRSSLHPLVDRIDDDTWATDQLYMAHFAVTDAHNGSFFAEERFSRASAGLAGAQAMPFRVWLEDWQAAAVETSFNDQVIEASSENATLNLRLSAARPIVLHGDEGLDPKGPEPGNASYYYAVTRWNTRGTITLGDEVVQVAGTSWLDREWSTSVLGAGVRGWDWFALQLDDGLDVMFYQLRDAEGNPTSYSGGALMEPDGSRRAFSLAAVTFSVEATWTSPRGGTYPSGWRLVVPDEGVDLRIDPVIANQELDVTIRYWEGAVDVEGTVAGEPVRGVGYAELTGYAESESRSQLGRH